MMHARMGMAMKEDLEEVDILDLRRRDVEEEEVFTRENRGGSAQHATGGG